MIRKSAIALIVVGALNGAAMAAPGEARIVTRHSMMGPAVVMDSGSPYQGVPGIKTYEVDGTGQRDVYVIERQIVDRSAVVSRAISQQPVRPHLVEVLVVNTTIYIDPQANYIQNGRYRINPNSIIPAAQRLWNSTHAQPARIIVSPNAAAAPPRDVTTIKPIMMIPKDDLKKLLIPQVPRAPAKAGKTVAMAD